MYLRTQPPLQPATVTRGREHRLKTPGVEYLYRSTVLCGTVKPQRRVTQHSVELINWRHHAMLQVINTQIGCLPPLT